MREQYGNHTHHRRKRHMKRLFLLLRNLAFLCAAISVCALLYHALSGKINTAEGRNTTAASALAGESAGPSGVVGMEMSGVNPMETTAALALGDFSAAFPSADTGGDALYSYQTDTVRIAIRRIQRDSVTYFLADVYVKYIDALQTAFAKGAYGKNIYAFPTKTAAANGAVFAVTGDYYSARRKGIVVRNGQLYRDVPSDDVCVLYRSGEMKTYTDETLDLSSFDSQNIWQAWSFGPALLTAEGRAVSEFTSDLKDRHPRCGIGYYAPGHYCFIVVDGRQKGYSIGVRLWEFADIFEKLGCKQAYNLDGGATAIMIFNGEAINQPYKGGRESGDIIYLK